jgi:hypothetical protein
MGIGLASHNSPRASMSPFPDSDQSVADVKRVFANFFSTTSNDLADAMDLVTDPQPTSPSKRDALLVLLPLLIVLSSLLFLLLLFLICVLFLRRRRGISLSDNDGPIDMSREELIDGEGGFESVEERWLESVGEETQRAYRRAKGEHDFNAACKFIYDI